MAMKHRLGGLISRATNILSAWGWRMGATGIREASTSLYSLTVPALDGSPIDLARYDGKVSLVVNVASECGFTPQYSGLQALHDELAPRGFTVLGFPSNEFGHQEPGAPGEIQAFCESHYGVRFPLFQKVVTRAGTAQSPVYRALGESGYLPAWTFAKYVVGRDGRVKAFFPTQVAPDARELRAAIDAALVDADTVAGASLPR